MTIRYKILPDKNLLYVSGKNRPTIDEQIRSLDSIARDPLYAAPMKKLVDFRGCDPMGYSYDEIKRFTKAKAELKERFKGEKTAVIVNNELDFGVSRVFGARLEPHNMDLNVFRNLEDARHWLDVELEESDLEFD